MKCVLVQKDLVSTELCGTEVGSFKYTVVYSFSFFFKMWFQQVHPGQQHVFMWICCVKG